VCTGLRPGEKLHEALIAQTETLEATQRPNIVRVKGLAASPLDETAYAALVQAVKTGDIALDDLMAL
jgi:FlaA1/EpsC-like NDP-sugar epimerase